MLTQTSLSQSADKRYDLLPVVVQLFYAILPIEILMVFIGTTQVTAALVVAAVLGAMGGIWLASSRLGLSFRADRPMVYAILFLAVGTLSTLTTPYGMPAIQKGAINLSAMAAMVLMLMVVKQAIIQWPQLFQHIVRITAMAAAIGGGSVVLQAFLVNVLLQPELFDLSFLNALWGNTFWILKVEENGVIRPHGIFAEPSFVSGYVGLASGLAMTRLGLVGGKWRVALARIVPGWAAVIVLTGLILTFSAVVYAGLLAASSATLASRMRFSVRSLVFLTIGVVAVLLVLVLAALQAGNLIVDRVTDLVLFSQISDASAVASQQNSASLTVQVLFFNAYVALKNVTADPLLGAGIGAHPFAHAALLPFADELRERNLGLVLNATDAAALILRLLSETGFLGTTLFIATVLSAWFRVRKVVLAGESAGLAGGHPFTAMAMGLNGGLIGVFVAFLIHRPIYYAPEFWGLLALCVAIPALASLPASFTPQPTSRDT